MTRWLLFVALAICLAPLLVAQNTDYSTFDRALLPVPIGRTPGAYGSLWETKLTIFNASDTPAILFPREGCIATGDACALPIEFVVNPRETLRPAINLDANRQPIQFLYIDPSHAGEIFLNLRVRELVRNPASPGFTLPLIRSTELRTSRIEMLDVPADPRTRVTLRILETSPIDSFFFRIRVFSEGEPGALTEVFRSASVPPAASSPVPLTPGIIELSDFLNAPVNIEHVRVEVEPLTRGSMFWAFISVTDKVTQDVLIITPQ